MFATVHASRASSALTSVTDYKVSSGLDPWGTTFDQAVPGTNVGVHEYTYPKINGSSTHTSGISIDSNGLVWFDDSLQNSFGSFPDTGTGSFSMYNAPSSRSHPHDGLRVDGSNRIWFDEEYAEKLAEVIQ